MIKLININKYYKSGSENYHALRDINLEFGDSGMHFIHGKSGSGKSTLLYIIGGLDKPTEGSVVIDEKDINELKEKEIARFRRQDIGFVFQFYNLVQNLTALENVELAHQICKNPLDGREVLSLVGLENRQNNFPSQLSGGEQQRVSIARALAKNPKLLLCDEPTGALDYNTGKQILKLLQDTSRETGMTVIVITHNQALTPMADRVISMKSGRVVSIETNENPMSVEDIEW